MAHGEGVPREKRDVTTSHDNSKSGSSLESPPMVAGNRNNHPGTAGRASGGTALTTEATTTEIGLVRQGRLASTLRAR